MHICHKKLQFLNLKYKDDLHFVYHRMFQKVYKLCSMNESGETWYDNEEGKSYKSSDILPVQKEWGENNLHKKIAFVEALPHILYFPVEDDDMQHLMNQGAGRHLCGIGGVEDPWLILQRYIEEEAKAFWKNVAKLEEATGIKYVEWGVFVRDENKPWPTNVVLPVKKISVGNSNIHTSSEWKWGMNRVLPVKSTFGQKYRGYTIEDGSVIIENILHLDDLPPLPEESS